ncbi:bifunctional 23S rRNA (guanine(2069)-N(7))-methyltransferase RlmK/23S rRNA (guanine(2445)-N(2))-methyltransferase RlmL [uncultured Parolsenella sp.]|uniref:bifunctional 23S rRNA (guanine(2069)-N(7))-methyltransferase RlmK/23S rRNA (guanine(2445)-N(2))-methyltransferase RlmL n=1 Tax=uncultured Parolsenella sp. TaxID=2083008 RepID=UPI00342E6E4F
MTDAQTARSEELELFATCPKGFEAPLAAELAGLGAKGVRALHGQVAFAGTLADAYRVCLWSRIASRVVLVLGHGAAANADELYQTLREVCWENHLSLTSTFAVDAHGTNNELRNTQFIALRAKDAICDRLQAKLGARPSVETRHPDVTVVARVRNDRVTFGIDLSGEPLFRRASTRRAADDGLGGLRPDYAAAVLAMGAWHRCCRRDDPTLAVAFSGSGTLVAEAASAALDRAPGLLRTRWGFTGWLGHDEDAWAALLAEADERAEKGAARAEKLHLVTIDPRKGAAAAARASLRAAGLDVAIASLASADELARRLAPADASATLAAVDLSWLGADELAREVAAIGLATATADALPQGSRLVALSTTPTLDASLGLAAIDQARTFVGRDDATITTYETGTPAAPAASPADANAAEKDDAAAEAPAAPARATVTLKDGTTLPVLVPQSDQFAARLAKVAKLRAKWGRREGISCYRVYDTDLPDYAVAIDLYQAAEGSRGADAHGRWLVVQEYAAPKDIDPELARRRLLDVLAIAPHVLGVDPACVTLRVRRHAKGGSQYANEGEGDKRAGRRGRLALAPGAHLVEEGGLIFEVNLAERLDTGLFLDHRDVRARVREMAKDMQGSKRFLNLFAYTGSATCYAADGGAKHTTTVDLSRTYLDWAERNMERNGFVGPEHEYVQADVVRWVSEQRHTPNRWDLVFCDPPTFSNSKRMGRDVFDVQRDHAELLIGISRLLTANGICLFSCNLRGFEPDVEALAKAGVEIADVTAGTIPEDFKRNAKIHHVYLVKRTPRPEGAPTSAAPARAQGSAGRTQARPDSHANEARRDERPYGSQGGRPRYGAGRRDDHDAGQRGPHGLRGDRPYGSDRREDRSRNASRPYGSDRREERNHGAGRPYGAGPHDSRGSARPYGAGSRDARGDRPRYDTARPDGPRPHTARSQGPMRPLMGNGPRPSQHGGAGRPRLQGNGPRPSQFGGGHRGRNDGPTEGGRTNR